MLKSGCYTSAFYCICVWEAADFWKTVNLHIWLALHNSLLTSLFLSGLSAWRTNDRWASDVGGYRRRRHGGLGEGKPIKPGLISAVQHNLLKFLSIRLQFSKRYRRKGFLCLASQDEIYTEFQFNSGYYQTFWIILFLDNFLLNF